MSVSSKLFFDGQTAGNKASPVLAGLSSDSGAGNRLGQNFSQVLKDMQASPPVPVEHRNEAASGGAAPSKAAADRDAARKRDTNPAQQDQPAQARASGAAEAAAPKTANADDRSKPDKAVKRDGPSDPTDLAQSAASKSGKGSVDDASAQDPTDLLANDVAIDARSQAALDPGQVKPAFRLDEQAAIETDAVGPESLASLMPSVAHAVFRQDASAQAAGSGKQDTKTSKPTGTEERTQALSAKAQDMAALSAAQDATADQPLKDSAAAKPEPLGVIGSDKTARGDAPSFGSLMQAGGAMAASLAAAPNAAAPQSHAAGTPVQMRSDLLGPGFGPEMAARLTILAGTGVQKAELHLNPADMGPVSVQIQLDGLEAKVQFHAQHALTREVLERSLPELAAALRDAGLMLSGSGVFQQSQDSRQDTQARTLGAPGQSRNIGPDTADGTPLPVTQRHTQLGVLDMYA